MKAHLVKEAAQKLRNKIVQTPLLEAPLLNELVQERLKIRGLRVQVKAECLQHTGAFKFRGALNRLLQEDMAEDGARERGVVAFSSGNFAQVRVRKSMGTKCKCNARGRGRNTVPLGCRLSCIIAFSLICL